MSHGALATDVIITATTSITILQELPKCNYSDGTFFVKFNVL